MGNVEKAVHNDISSMIDSVVLNVDFVMESQKALAEKRRKEIIEEMDIILKKLGEISTVIKSLYLDTVKGVLGEIEFMELNKEFNKEKESLSNKYNQLKAALDIQIEVLMRKRFRFY